jgi:Nif-specific regulatory protein
MSEISDGSDLDLAKNHKPDPFFDPYYQFLPGATAYVDAATLVESFRRLQIIYGFSRALSGEADTVKMPEVVLEAVIRLINLERGFVAVFDESGQLRVLTAHNIELPEDPVEWPVSKTIIGRVMKEGIPVLSSDAQKDDRFSNINTVNLNRIRSVMCVPLGTKGSYIGLLYVDNRLKADSFSQTDLFFLTVLGHYLYFNIRSTDLPRPTLKRQATDERALVSQEELQEQNIVGRSRPLLAAYGRLRRVAERDAPILLLGETGTGKELFAEAAHRLNPRRSKSLFLALNISALSETLIESELFGHEKGAFSNATYTKVGKFEMADSGTLFLDEVGEIPLSIQPKLLRVLETGCFERVGGTKQLHTDIRLVCATNKNLEEAVKKGLFREDLYYRLKGVTIQLPPLRERVEDIPDLVSHALKRLGSEKVFTDDSMKLLQSYNWPGNVRQLVRFVEEMDLLSDGQEMKPEDLPEYIAPEAPRPATEFLPLSEIVARIECEYIQRALELTGGNNERAIEMLGISRAKFFDRKKAYGL